MSDDALRSLLSLPEEERARALLDMTLEAARPEVADAARVCALPAWFDAQHLALLTGKSVEEAAALVEAVAGFSFVQRREGGGHVYHEATRARLLDWWREAEQRARFAELAGRLGQVYLALAREQDSRLSGPDYLDALGVMDRAYPNVRAAWEEAVELEDWNRVWSFAHALTDYQGLRGLWQEKLAWGQRGLVACEKIGDTWGCGAMHNTLANTYTSLPTGDRSQNFQQAIIHYQSALEIATLQGLSSEWAATQNNLGLVYAALPTGERAANLAQAIECYREALRFYTPEAAPLDYAATQNNLGLAYHYLHDYGQAIEEWGRVIALDPQDGTAHYNTACAYALMGQVEEACAWLEKAIALDGKYRQLARDDADFDGIREDERFKVLAQ